MAIPTRRQVLKREKIREVFGKDDKPKEETKPLTEEEHKARLEKLRALGLVK